MVFAKRMTGGGVAAVLVLALLSPLAQAAPPNDREWREGIRKGNNTQQQSSTYEQRDAKRPYFQRRENGEEQRPPRLSPDERRQLRRDIKDAGREIYLPRR